MSTTFGQNEGCQRLDDMGLELKASQQKTDEQLRKTDAQLEKTIKKLDDIGKQLGELGIGVWKSWNLKPKPGTWNLDLIQKCYVNM